MFKRGDKLRCIDIENGSLATGELTLDKIYIAQSEAHGKTIDIINNYGNLCGLYMSHFELVTEKEKPVTRILKNRVNQIEI